MNAATLLQRTVLVAKAVSNLSTLPEKERFAIALNIFIETCRAMRVPLGTAVVALVEGWRASE